MLLLSVNLQNSNLSRETEDLEGKKDLENPEERNHLFSTCAESEKEPTILRAKDKNCKYLPVGMFCVLETQQHL